MAATTGAGGFSRKLDREAAAARWMEESAANQEAGNLCETQQIVLLSITTQYFVVRLE